MIVGIISALFFSFIDYVINRELLTPLKVFNVLWALVLLINTLNPYSLFPFKQESIIVVVLGLIIYNLTYLVCEYFVESKNNAHYKPKDSNFINKHKHEETIKNEKLFILQLIVTFFVFLLFLRMLPYLQNGGFSVVRTVYSSNLGFMTTLERYFYIHFIIFPLNSCLLLISIILWFKKNIRFRYLILPIINTLFISLVTGGRMALFNMAIYFVIVGAICKCKIKISKRQKYFVLMIIILICIYVIINTLQRQANDEQTFIDSILLYFSGGMKVLDIAIENPHFFGLNTYMYGTCFVAGLLSFFLTFIYYTPVIGSIISIFPTDLAQVYLNSNINISSNLSMNAFATMYYYFMRDYGIVGVVILTSIFSILCCSLFIKIKNNNKIISIYLLVNLFIVIIYSPCWWEPFRIEFWTPFLHLLWVRQFIRLKVKIHDENFTN